MTASPAPGSARTGAWNWTGACRLEEIRAAAAAARAWLADHGLPETDLAAWELMLAEAGNNAVLHADPEGARLPVAIRLAVTGDRVIARVLDHTPGFDWPENPSLPADDAENGRGLFLLATLSRFQHYDRNASGNVLTLERPVTRNAEPEAVRLAHRLADAERTLQLMTEELSACYESLNAVFRLTAASRQAGTLADFGALLLERLAAATGSDCALLRVAEPGGGLLTVAALGALDSSRLVRAEEAAAIRTRQDRWLDPAPGTAAGEPLSGLVHPFHDGDALMGVLSIARRDRREPPHAGDVSVVHTFAEFFAQHLLSRRHAEAAEAASAARREIELAGEIQRSLLPVDLPRDRTLSAAGHCESARQVGGDFYDLLPWGPDAHLFVMADVMGKGVGASMMAAVTRSVLRTLGPPHDSAARILTRLAQRMHADLSRLEMFVTLAVGVVDHKAGEIRIANAGHCPVLVAGPVGLRGFAEPESPPIGLLPDPEYRETVVPIAPGTRVLAFTDGLTDPRGTRPHFASAVEVAEWFAETARAGGSAAILRDALAARLAGLPGDTTPPADDQAFLVLACEPA